MKLDTNKVRVSGLNDIKKYVIKHHKGENVSLKNVENTIIKLLDDQYDHMISENGVVTIEQFVIRDKRYWRDVEFINNGGSPKSGSPKSVPNTCMKYFKHFPRHDNITMHDYRHSNVFDTPVGRFLKGPDALYKLGSENYIFEDITYNFITYKKQINGTSKKYEF